MNKYIIINTKDIGKPIVLSLEFIRGWSYK